MFILHFNAKIISIQTFSFFSENNILSIKGRITSNEIISNGLNNRRQKINIDKQFQDSYQFFYNNYVKNINDSVKNFNLQWFFTGVGFDTNPTSYNFTQVNSYYYGIFFNNNEKSSSIFSITRSQTAQIISLIYREDYLLIDLRPNQLLFNETTTNIFYMIVQEPFF